MLNRGVRLTIFPCSSGCIRHWLRLAVLLFMGPLLINQASAEPLYPISLVRVADNVYSAIGATGPPTYENGGHNNNLSFVIGSEGVLVFNSGDSYLLAKAFHQAIKQLTPVPVRWVAIENAQGHAMLGNSYWAEQGVAIIAQRDAEAEIKAHGHQALARMLARNRDKGEGTSVALPTEVFDQRKHLSLGDVEVELINFGPAHSPGDISLWIPAQSLIITGDLAFHQRMLAIFPHTDTAGWITAFNQMAALQPRILVPGHGEPTSVAEARRWTVGYLEFLRAEVGKILENDGDLEDAYDINQSDYAHLHAFDELAAKNAGRVYQQMEADYF